MNKLLIIPILLLFTNSIISQKKHWIDYNGEVTKKENATHYFTFIKTKGLYLLNTYSSSNDLIESVQCLKKDTSTKSGEYSSYYESGKIHKKGKYLDGKKTEKWITYDQYGHKIDEEYYIKGLQEKSYYQFNSKGDTIVIGLFNKGLKNGQWTTFHSNGKKQTEIFYSNDLQEKSYYQFNSKGDTIVIGVFNKGLKNGQWITFYSNGKKQTETFYSNDLQEKSYYQFNSKGDTIVIGMFNKGLKNGQWTTFKEAGTINCEKIYLEDKLDGESKCYHDNGKIYSITKYSKGKKENKTLYYTKEGKLFSIATFKGGESSMMSYLARNTNYPPLARDNDIQGRALISFTVNKDGTISGMISANPPGTEVHKSLIKEAKRVISSMPKWTPAISEGKPISCSFTVPVNFKIR